jgi:hypothetical protein
MNFYVFLLQDENTSDLRAQAGTRCAGQNNGWKFVFWIEVLSLIELKISRLQKLQVFL